jgi:hypothetical protein
MKSDLDNWLRWVVVVGYATAMAWVEAAVVFYLRTMVNRIEPHQRNPLPIIGNLGKAELVREAATLVMLLAVGILAGRCWRSRLGYAAIAFGVWDILYYAFLKVLCGWPHSLLNWDILFLLPLPWWGPVLAPVLISVLMILWGTFASHVTSGTPLEAPEMRAWGLNLCGVGLALYVFMADTLHSASKGADMVRQIVPTSFNWWLFWLALLLMSWPLLQILLQMLVTMQRENTLSAFIPVRTTAELNQSRTQPISTQSDE